MESFLISSQKLHISLSTLLQTALSANASGWLEILVELQNIEGKVRNEVADYPLLSVIS